MVVLGGAIWPSSCSRAGLPLPGRPTRLLQALGAESPLAASPALRSFHLLSFQSQHHPCPFLRPGLCSEKEDCQQALSFLGGGAWGRASWEPHDLWYPETYVSPQGTLSWPTDISLPP